MSELDILSIDSKIRKKFEEEYNKLPIYKEKLEEIQISLENTNFNHKIRKTLEKGRKDLLNYIEEVETNKNFHFYIMETVIYIEKYKKILKTPIKLNFMGKQTKNNKEKISVIDNFLEAVSKYMDIEINISNKKSKIRCLNCPNKKDFDIIEGNTYICNHCYAKQIIMKHNSSYNDIDRINIYSKYMYDRKIHFRDCIKQYQGKQNSTIPDKIYTELEEEFRRHHLLCNENNSNIKQEKFKNITKNHVLIFLKELNYSKHYENVHLIHYNLTGIKPADISHLEDQLLDDFDLLTDLYDRIYKHINRKNFINTQYVLYQLLRRHRHSCKKEEFIILKTNDRKSFHDEICKTLFEELGWNHTPFY